MKRWQTIDRLVDLIETAEAHPKIEEVAENISSVDVEEMRIRLVNQSFLHKEIEEKGELAKWGKYLRAPDVYFELLDKCKDKLIPLKDIAEVRFGIKTGINEFFYLEITEQNVPSGEGIEGCVHCRNGRGWEGLIEEKYLRAVIKSPKESESITIDPTKLKFKIFLCNESKADLRKKGDKYTLKYIEWGEKQRTKENIPWMEVPSVQGRKFWYGINIQGIPDGIISCGIRATYKIYDNKVTQVLADKRMYEINTKNEYVIPLLNSSLFHLYVESDTRELGDGFIDLTVYEVEEALFPKTELLNKKILTLFEKVKKREIKEIIKEYKQKDRIEFDKAILTALGLDADSYLLKIYEGITELVHDRLLLPTMRKNLKKEDTKFAYGKVKTDVIDDCLPDGIRKFPQDFYTKGNYEELEFETYSTNGKPLTADSFFNRYQMKTEEGETIFELDSEVKAEFAEILSQHETYQIKIPANEKIVEQIIKNYHSYISELKDQLEANAKEKLHNWSEAEKMTKEILEEFGVNSK
jgi:hypothetical protein